MMDVEDIRHNKELVGRYRRNLRELEKDAANFGAYTPPYVRTEIDAIRAKVAQLEEEIQQSLQRYYRYVSNLRRNSSWQTVSNAMGLLDDLEQGYPDPEGLHTWVTQQRLKQLENDAEIASTRRDWVAAISALEALLRETSGDTELIRARLAEVQAKKLAADAAASRKQRISKFIAAATQHWYLGLAIIVVPFLIWARITTGSTTPPSAFKAPTYEQQGATAESFTLLPTGVATTHPQDTCSLAGGKIVFQARHDGKTEIHMINPDGTIERNVTPNATRELVPALSPTGTIIAFQSPRSGNLDIYTIGTNGDNPQNLTNNIADDNTPTWSPNGQQIAFMSNRDGQGNIYNFNIYIMRADGSDVQRFTFGSGLDKSPTWSPDGRRIAYVSNRNNQFDMYIANVDGSGEIQITNTPDRDENFPAWSPDGQHIVFSSKQGDNPAKIFQINVDGSELRQLTTDAADDDHPSWSPDGDCIAFEATLNNNSQIYVMRVAEAQVKRSISSGSSEDHNPSWSQ